jgi:hypothetical protein
MSLVEIVSVDRWKRTVTLRRRPQSMREVMDALVAHWKEHEVDYPISEVIRFERPQHLFYAVNWLERP